MESARLTFWVFAGLLESVKVKDSGVFVAVTDGVPAMAPVAGLGTGLWAVCPR